MARHSRHTPQTDVVPDTAGGDSSAIPLTSLPPGTDARVHQILAQDQDAARLKAMGLCQDRKLELVKAGDPLIVRVLGTRIGLSARLARDVLVKPCPPGLTGSVSASAPQTRPLSS